jgi:hypothetical protein
VWRRATSRSARYDETHRAWPTFLLAPIGCYLTILFTTDGIVFPVFSAIDLYITYKKRSILSSCKYWILASITRTPFSWKMD